MRSRREQTCGDEVVGAGRGAEVDAEALGAAAAPDVKGPITFIKLRRLGLAAAGLGLVILVLDKSQFFHERNFPSTYVASQSFTGVSGGACEAICRDVQGGCSHEEVIGLTWMGFVKQWQIRLGLAPWKWGTHTCNGYPCGERRKDATVRSVLALGLPLMPAWARTHLPTARGIAPPPEAQLLWPGSDYLEFMFMTGGEGAVDWQMNDHHRSTSYAILYELAHAKPSETAFIDIGLNIGWYSVQAGLLGFERIGVDMQPACIKYARCNQELNQIGLGFTALNLALSPVPDAPPVRIDAHSCTGGGSMSYGWGGAKVHVNVSSKHLGVVLNEWIAATPARRNVDFIIKFDVEGFEPHLIQMLIDGGLLKKVKSLIVEMTPGNWPGQGIADDKVSVFRPLMETLGFKAILLPQYMSSAMNTLLKDVPIDVLNNPCSLAWQEAGYAYPPSKFEDFRKRVFEHRLNDGTQTNWWFTHVTC